MSDPRLYIIMRTDMESMNAGKAMAQAAHAANAFQASCGDEANPHGRYANWFESTEQGFGTTITLAAVDESQLIEVVENAEFSGLPAQIIHDPTYPVRDGKVTHLIPVNTCGYVFVPEPELVPSLLARLPLHP